MPELLVKTVRELPNGNILFEKRLYFLTERDIIELRKKTNWVKGKKGLFAGSVPMGGVKLSKREYGKITHEINTNYYSKYMGKKVCYHTTFWKDGYYTYKFENHGFNDYNFVGKKRN